MRQEVPQFIDVEDKVFGPFTFKQFIYMAGGAALAYLSHKIIPTPFSILGIVFFGGFAVALAFYKPNNRPFLEYFQNWVAYQFKSKLYLWKKPEQKKAQTHVPTPPTTQPASPVQKPERTIADLARNLDILDQGNS
jgi:hypothetical protein